MAGFMDSWNGFFGHAPGSTLMDRLSSPQTMGLLQAAAALQNGNQSFGQALSSGLGGFAQGAMMSGQMAQQKKRGQREDQQWELEQQKLQSEQARAAKVAEIQAKTARGEQLTPGDLFTLDPGAFAKQQLEAQNPQAQSTIAKAAQDRLRGLISDADFEAIKRKETYIAPQAPREAAETWNLITPEEAAAMQLPPGQSYMRSTRGKIDRVPAPSSGISVGPDGTVQIGGSVQGKPPEGYRWSEDRTRLEPIPGGPKDPNSNTGITTDQRNKLASARVAHGNIASLMDRMKTMVQQGGTAILPGERNSQLGSMHTAILMEMKNLLELGVLNGNDEELIRRMIPDPTSMSSLVKDPLIGLAEARGYIDTKLKNAEQIYGGGASAMPVPPGTGDTTAPPPPPPPPGGSKEIDDLFMQFGM